LNECKPLATGSDDGGDQSVDKGGDDGDGTGGTAPVNGKGDDADRAGRCRSTLSNPR